MSSKKGTSSAATTAAASSLGIPFAKFPDTLPHFKARFFVSIIVGQTHLHWALHDGYDAECKSVVFWKTTLTTLPELKKAYNTSSEALCHHLPKHWRHYFFGGTKDEPKASTKENAWICCWKRPNPIVNVYVVTFGAILDEALGYIFADIPSRLDQLAPSHFWPEACCVPHGNLERHDVNFGIELQRRANVKGAVELYGHPALVLDGGSFHGLWNYTATDVNGKMMGGGYSANMAYSWLVLQQSTGKLPLLQYSDLMEKYPQLAVPIVDLTTTSTGADGNTSNSLAPATGVDNPRRVTGFANSTEGAILEDALLTLGLRCRYVVNHWLHSVGKAELIEDQKPAAREEASGSNQPATAATLVTVEAVEGDKPTAVAAEGGQTPAVEGDKAATATTTDAAEGSKGGQKPAAASAGISDPGADDAQSKPAAAAEKDQPTTSPAVVDPTATAATTTSDTPVAENGKSASVAEDPGKASSTANAAATTPAATSIMTEAAPTKNHQRFVVVTGAEKEFIARVLQPDHGGVLEVDPSVTLPAVNKDFFIHSNKHLAVYAIGRVIYEAHLELAKVELNSVSERMRRDLMGLRAAVEFAKPQYPDGDLWYRGSVVKVDRGIEEGNNWKSSLSDDLYLIRFDDGDTHDVNPYELYCALMKYHEIGERDVDAGEIDEESEYWRQEKKRDSKMYGEQLRSVSPFVQDALAKVEADKLWKEKEGEKKKQAKKRRQAQREDHEEEAEDFHEEMEEEVEEANDEDIEAEEEQDANKTPGRKSTSSRGAGKKTPTAAASRQSPSTSGRGKKASATPSSSSRKRVKREEAASPPRPKRVKKTDAESAGFVGKRVAKKFDDGEIYFGTVRSFSPGDPDDPDDEDFWWIKYDDCDEEQFDKKDMTKGFRLYTSRKHLDKNWSE